jgi:hypothetical protein
MSAYNNVKVSLFKFCTTFGPTLTLYNFDAYTANTTLPEADLIGLKGLSMDVNGHLLTIRTWVGVSTDEADINLFRLDPRAGDLFEALKPGTEIDALNADTGAVVGKLIVMDGTTLSPTFKASNRPLKFVEITLSTSLWV